jgi:hypothetical protein
MKITKTAIVMIVLVVWAVFSSVFIGWTLWQQFKNGKMAAAFENGATQGYQQAILGIAQAAQNCQAVPLTLGNDKDGKAVTMNIIDVACVKQDGGAKAADSKTPEKK